MPMIATTTNNSINVNARELERNFILVRTGYRNARLAVKRRMLQTIPSSQYFLPTLPDPMFKNPTNSAAGGASAVIPFGFARPDATQGPPRYAKVNR